MFCSPALAARIDRAEGRMCAAMAHGAANENRFVLPIAGGVAIYAGPDSPSNKMIGVGFDSPIAEAELADVENRFAQRLARLQAEISTLADVSVHSALFSRGYSSRGFENVLGHSLKAIAPAPDGITVDPATPSDFPDLADTLTQSFANPDIGGVGGDALPPLEEIRRWILLTLDLPGFRGYLARINGELAGAASLRIEDRIAQFSGAGTLPRFRRRGVQTALLRARLAQASHAACEIAVVCTQPASRSQQNVQREGFALLYSRQLLVKAAPAKQPIGDSVGA